MASLEWIQDMLPAPLNKLPTFADYEGQRRAERLYQAIILICAVIGFLVGYKEQRFSYTVYAVLGGFFLSCLLILPPWPCFRVKELQWQKVLEEPKEKNAPADAPKPAKKKR